MTSLERLVKFYELRKQIEELLDDRTYFNDWSDTGKRRKELVLSFLSAVENDLVMLAGRDTLINVIIEKEKKSENNAGV